MKMKYIITAIVSLGLLCALLTAPVSVSAADNLAANGDLEMGSTNGWEIDSAVIDSSVKHGGNYSLKLTATAAYTGAAYKVIPVRKNATVTVSLYYRYAENPSGKLYHVYTYKGENPWTGAYSNAETSFSASSSDYATWKQATYTFNSGDYEAIYLKFCPEGNGSVPCYIDDLVVTSVGGDEPETAPYLTSFGTKYNRPLSASDNLLANGGFESVAGAQWNTSAFIKGNLSVVSDATAPEGDKVLYFNGGSAATLVWHTFPMAVEKNTQYTFSAWVKSPRLSDANDATATFGVMGSANEFLIYEPYHGNGHGAASLSTAAMQLMATAPDDAWHLRSVTFNSGSATTVYIGVYGAASQLYLDDMALFKSAYGVEYISPLRTDTVTANTNTGNRYCADEDVLIPDPHMTGEAARQYWSDNPAWRNGFLSFAEAEDDHAAVLKYAESDHPEWGLHYIKWSDVTPNTDYTFTVDVKRLTAGGGRIALLDDNILSPAEFYSISFSAVDSGWQTYSVTFNSGVYSRIGFAVVDGGGAAYIDKVRLFKTADGIAEESADALQPVLKPQGGQTSAMEMTTGDSLSDMRFGVAFLMELEALGVQWDTQYKSVLTNAKVDVYGDGTLYPLKGMGALMTNRADVGEDLTAFRLDSSAVEEATVVDIPAVYLWSLDTASVSFAVRVINVPWNHLDTLIYARPYYVFEQDGQEIVVYGDVYHRSYNNT